MFKTLLLALMLSATALASTSTPTPSYECGDYASPMSIEGAEGAYCVIEPACVDDFADGNCPGAQDGLTWGSYCDIVRTGVYGCKPYNGTDTPTGAIYPTVRSCAGNDAGDRPVSVVMTGTFCAAHPVCSGTIFGNCPGKQEGLERDSQCTIISTGVYGCVA